MDKKARNLIGHAILAGTCAFAQTRHVPVDTLAYFHTMNAFTMIEPHSPESSSVAAAEARTLPPAWVSGMDAVVGVITETVLVRQRGYGRADVFKTRAGEVMNRDFTACEASLTPCPRYWR